MSDEPFGIVIVSWNVRDLLARCLYSLYAELDRWPIEARVVVVDNASYDGSPDMIRLQFPRVELLAREDNPGFAKGNNLGLHHLGFGTPAGRPALCLLLNPDTEVQPGAIKTLLDVMRSRSDAAIVTSRLSYGSGAFQHSAFHFPGLGQLYNGELAVVQGPFSVQAEATKADVHRLGGLSTASFWGGYAFVSFFLTGESRPYLASEGEWDRVFPTSSKGAWEVAARLSTMDLDDASTGVLGGKGTNITVGLNWYINGNFKLMADYVHVNLNGNAVPDQGTAIPGDKFDIIQLRASLAL